MSKENVHLLPEFQDVLRFYGYSLETEMTTQVQTTNMEVMLNTSPATITVTTEQQDVGAKETASLPDSTTFLTTKAPSLITSTNLQSLMTTKFYEPTDFSSLEAENNVTTITPGEFQTTVTTEAVIGDVNKEEAGMTPTNSVPTQSSTHSNDMSVEATTINEVRPTHFPETTETLATFNPEPASIPETTSTREETVFPEMQRTGSNSPMETVANTDSSDYTSKETSASDTVTTETSTIETELTASEIIFETPTTTIISHTIDEITEVNLKNDSSTASLNDTEMSLTTFTSLELNDNSNFTGEATTETATIADKISRQRREFEGYRAAWQSTVMNQEDTLSVGRTCQVRPCYPFFIDGLQEEYVPVMSLTATFRFAYLRKLHATALEFPLDNDKYKLLLILPVDKCGLKSLIYSLSLYPLRLVYEALILTRVNAVIPTFMADGDISLSTTLKKLGIWDIFDPKRANLTGMSDDLGLYVQNIEQTIKVNIRNYMDPQNSEIAAYGPVERFYATHPFLYFVLDKETHVTLILGKMMNPLSKKIN